MPLSELFASRVNREQFVGRYSAYILFIANFLGIWEFSIKNLYANKFYYPRFYTFPQNIRIIFANGP